MSVVKREPTDQERMIQLSLTEFIQKRLNMKDSINNEKLYQKILSEKSEDKIDMKNLELNFSVKSVVRIGPYDEIFKSFQNTYNLEVERLSVLNGGEFIGTGLGFFLLNAKKLGLLECWKQGFFVSCIQRTIWFGFVESLLIKEIQNDELKLKDGRNSYFINKNNVIGDYQVGDIIKDKFIIVDSTDTKHEMIISIEEFEKRAFSGLGEGTKFEKKLRKKLIDILGDFSFNHTLVNSNFESKSSLINEEEEDTIKMNGISYEKYKFEELENKSDYIGRINNDLKKINRKLILMKLSLTSEIAINENLLNDIKEINKFFSNFFKEYKTEIEEGLLYFDKELIEESANICETLLIMTEETDKNGLLTNKESQYYSIFKNSNEFLLESIKKLSVLTKIYEDEEIEKKNEIEKLIPKGNEYTINSGFQKILETLLDSHKFRRNTILIGHAGFGKTFGCKITAQLLGQPYYKFSCNAQTQIEEFFGSISQNEKGIIVREKGPLTKMMEIGGLFVFDEFNSMSQEAIKAINGILDSVQGHNGKERINIQISGKDFQINVHKNFRVCLTGNPVEFIDDYGMLSRVTNDLSRRSSILNTCNDFSGKEFIEETVFEYFSSMNIRNLDESINESEFKKEIIKLVTNLVKKLSITVGKGHIELNENNRFFILNRKDDGIGTLTNEEAMVNAVIPISTVILLPIKNIMNSFGSVKDPKKIVNLFVIKNLSLLLDLKDKIQMQLFNDLRLNLK